jgi:aminoglycoside phosphotransferase (APT) family kinase protein
MDRLPDEQILAQFSARIIAPLGGRVNQHWLVEAQGERLVLRRWAAPADSVAYELRLLDALAARGWPVAPAVAGPIVGGGQQWSMARALPGQPRATTNPTPASEQRERGRLLATFHAELAQLGGLGQRAGWRRCEEILGDPALDLLLDEHERARPEEVRILRWHLERARARAAGVPLHDRPGIVIHGDFTPWNLLFQDGKLSGILDFELAHWDHRVAEFGLSWRGRYDDVIYGYDEVAPLEPEEWAMLTPAWWAQLIDGACTYMRDGIAEDGWTVKKLLQRSPLMGPDAVEFH